MTWGTGGWHAAVRCALGAAASAAIGCGSAVSVCGCFPYDCAEHVACGAPDAPETEVEPDAPGEPDAPADPEDIPCGGDPRDGAPKDGCGVFASSSLGDDANPGTRALPVRTVRRAIELSRQGARRVYACAEIFPEAVAVPAGTQIWGGLDCAHGWAFIGDRAQATLAPAPDLIPLRIEGGAGKSVVADVLARSADAAQPSGSSIAALVLPGATVTFLRSALVAGNGAAGAPGADGGEGAAAPGTDGRSGGDACSADVVPGAPSVTTACDDVDSIGGSGGDGAVSSGDDGRDGLPEPISSSMDWGHAGQGQTLGADCTDGMQGLSGAHGAHGRGAVGRGGMITRAGWEGVHGTEGARGISGQGGGGGGGTLGGVMYCGMSTATPKGGASGGSGGGGGCGGNGGQGGGYGGASIALISLSAGVTLHDTKLSSANGGHGGNGGAGQIGGEGGSRGSGGAARNGSLRGCDGGRGGQGGNGGHGGGGLGGPSIGIAYLLDPPEVLGTLALRIGEPGKGGAGGRPDMSELAGQDGAVAEVLGFVQ
ncbi:hypothetical protein [Sorangium sp. So ce542]|uniref:hypothetical protein n=1 Tax=Sorangium sp. So ce542 TaxID=3133316 RepID=UPI003F627D5D